MDNNFRVIQYRENPWQKIISYIKSGKYLQYYIQSKYWAKYLFEIIMIVEITVNLTSKSILKGAQAWDIRDRVIYTERSHLGRSLEEWAKKLFV